MDIQIENLTKTYGTQRAVDNIQFDVKTGEVLGFLGPNGAGKSTTMKMITGYIGIETGDIKVGGQSVKDFPDEIKKHIGYLPENNPLYLDMPVIDYLEFCAALQGLNSANQQQRTKEMISVCGLNKEKHKKIGELSKGYRQRVGLAQAMIHDPEVLILDEPTTGLDPNQIVEIRKLIRNLGKEKTVILSTHILPEVEATCDRILIINSGSIAADGTADNLRKASEGKQIIKVRVEEGNSGEIISALKLIKGIEAVDFSGRGDNFFELETTQDHNIKKEIFKMCVEKNWILTELIPIETKLEDIFRNLTN